MKPLLSAKNLTVEFGHRVGTARFRAVDDVSFDVAPQATLGLVGESGSGKSTTARAVLGLVKPASGTIEWEGLAVDPTTHAGRRTFASRVQMVFQDPYSSLNPRKTIRQILNESLRIAKIGKDRWGDLVEEQLRVVGMSAKVLDRYPGSFSGGQRQRIGIARALIVGPELLICDEAVSALDVSVQAQVLNLLKEIQNERHISILFITHDLGVVRYIADEVMVLKRGKVVEQNTVDNLFSTPQHEYTKELLAAVPKIER